MREYIMADTLNVEQDSEMVRCPLCTNQVWIQKDRLEKHIKKAHSQSAAPRKSFTTYHAKLQSTFPPRVPSNKKASKLSGGSADRGKPGIVLISRTGSRLGAGRCAECGLEVTQLWFYADSNRGPVEICSSCKSNVFERSFEKNSQEANK
jgi:hypothetical protein